MFLAARVIAEDIYIAQSAAGGDSGVNCDNAHAASWFNTAGNWGGGAGLISPGDTVRLCGTFNSQLTVQASGTSGNRITILFESGANFTAANLQTAIATGNNNYLTIDGGVNGFIRNTNNGTSLGFQTGSSGSIYGTPTVGEITVRNLTLTNLFVNTPGGPSSSIGNAIAFTGVMTNIIVHNNYVTHQEKGVFIGYNAGNSGGFDIYSNTCINVNWGIGIGSGGVGAVSDGIMVHHNACTGLSTWDSSDNLYWHHNGVYLYADQTSAKMTNVSVYSNTYGPDLGTPGVDATAAIFMSSTDGMGILGPVIYNNVIYAKNPSSIPTPGAIYLWRAYGGKVFNNVIDGDNRGGIAVSLKISTNIVITNNICSNLRQPLYVADGAGGQLAACDYNCYFHNDIGGGNYGAGVFAGDAPVSWTTWIGWGFDPNAITNDPVFVNYSSGDFHIQSTSPIINEGASLESFFTTDKDNNIRSGVWDMGAYEFVVAAQVNIANKIRGRMSATGRVSVR